MKEAGQDTGVAPAKDSSTGWVVIWGIILLMFGHVGHCPVNADPLSGSQTATSGAGIPTSWSGRSGSPLTEQIMMRHVYEQIRSLKFAYEENINQLIRKVDTIDMKITRHSCDYNGIETLVRKIESLDIKVNRLETSNVHRLEELSKTIHTKGIRQELAMDGLVQKVDENHERIKQKLIFSEKRLDTINSKMQVYETSFTRIESRLTDIDNEISDISNTLDDIKSLSTFIDDKHNNTQRTMKEQLQAIKSESASRQQLEELSSSVKDIGSRLNDTAPMVRDDETVRLLSSDADRTLMMDLKAQINFESMKIEDKITSMYNNLWSRFMSLETTAKHLLKIGNITRRQLREDFQSLLQSEARFVEPESQENYMNLILDVLKRMLQEHKEQMDSNLQMSMTSQNIFIDSLNKSLHQSNRNEELKEMEITLSSILEKIIYTITNKTSRMDSRVVEMMQMIKEYRTQMMRSLSHLTKMVISLTEKNKEDRERFEKAMLDLTKMNEVIAFGIHDLYQKFEMIMNMTPPCEETTKTSVSNQTKVNESNKSIETKNPDNTDLSENLETEKVQENGIKIENDDVVKIYSENGSNIEHTNASYQVLNTTNSTQNNDTTTKKQISIVIPYEAIEDEEELRTKLQDFLSQLPVSRTEAIILTNTKKKNTDSRKSMEANREENSKNIGNSEQTIHIALNDGIIGNSTHKDNITTNTENKNERKNEKFQEIYKLPSDNNSTHDPVTKDTENKKLTDLDSKNDGIHDIPSSIEESKTSASENNEEQLQNGEEKRIYDFDGNEDIERSMEEPTKEKNLNEDLENMGNEDSLETTGTREVKHEEIIKTSTIRNEIFFKIPIFSIENKENITTKPKQSSQLVTQSYSLGNTTDIDNKTGVNQTHSLLKWMLVRERLFGKQERNSTSSTESATSSNLSTPKNKSIIETTTEQNLDDKSTPQRRTRQDIKQLFEDMKVRRMLRIQELENVGKESEMFLKEFEDELPFSDDDTPLARRDTSEHFRPITSSEEMTIHEPQFDLLYDEQQLPYSS